MYGGVFVFTCGFVVGGVFECEVYGESCCIGEVGSVDHWKAR